jgi:pyruvate/2-oxoglutarate dehydrogenase complex dihydrolipoamide dehydrogenase (E3) component
MLTLCERGHDVVLYEKSAQLGGWLVPGSALPFKQDVRDYLKYLICQAGKAPARVLLNTEATKAALELKKYDAIIIAAGSKPVIPQLPGIDKPHVHQAYEADCGKFEVGKKIVIVGAGSVGLESALHLIHQGKDVTIIEMLPDLSNLRSSAGGAFMEFTRLIDELKISIRHNCRLEEVTDNSVVCRNVATSETIELPADTVLLAVGVASNNDVVNSLRHCAPETEVFVVGDASTVGNIALAVRSGFRAAAYL